MPHFGLIDDDMEPAAQALLRAKLHMRGGDIRLKRSEISDAIASYYDAFSSAMMRYYLSVDLKNRFDLPDVSDITDDHEVFLALKRTRVIDESFTDINYHQMERLLEMAIEGCIEKYNYLAVIGRLRIVMEQLDVLPIIPGELPEENAVTL